MKKAFLFLLGLIAFIGVQAQTSPYTGSEIKAGNFYIYNVQSGYWLQNNNRVGDWNSQVQLGPDGFEWELIAREDGTWQLNPKFGNNHSLNISNGYIDTGDAVSGWTLTPVEGVTNGFTITGGDQMLGTNADKLLDKHASGDNAVFQLVTFSERWSVAEGQFAEVSGDKPMDLTWLIPGADMNIADEHANELVQTAPSQASAKFVTGQTNNPHGNGIREIWNNPGGSYDIGYKLTNLPGGVYRFMVSGYYRDGAREGVGAKYKNGTEVIRPEIYINEKTQPIMSICEPQKTAAGSGCNYSSDGIYIPDNTGEASTATASGFYENKAIKLVLADGADEISLGVRASDGVDADWLILDKFQLVYYGPENLESSLAMLNAAIEAAEAWDASVTSDAMAQTLAEAIDAAKGKLSAIDSDEIEAAAEELNAALKQAQSVDVSVLKATAALANKEGLDTAEADDVVANATDAGAVSSALFNLQAARKINAQKLPDVYTGSAPADGEKVYIYNLGTGMFLGTGASYNTHCAVDQVGIEIELVADGDGFKMKTNRGGGWLNKGNRETSTYVDCPEKTWYFISVSDGIYNISFDGQANNLLGYNPLSVNDDGKTYWSSIGIKREDANDPMNQWKIVTAAEREALLAEASKENPVDVSYLIPAASLNKQDTFPWVAEGDAHHAKVDNFENWGFEFWNNSSFKFSQTIENLPAGLYEIKVQSFWREGDGANQVAIVNSGGALNQKAYLFANGAQELLPNIASVLDFVPGVGGDATTNKGIFPNWVNEAIEYMETGAYWATVKAVVEEDGTLTLGIAADDNSGPYDWSVIDNFRLTYLGEASDYDRALVSIEDAKNYSVFTEVDGQKYYVTADGKLTNDESARGAFGFQKVNGAQYAEGFLLNSQNNTRFSNPYTTTEAALTNGSLNISTNNRTDWEAQVFFQNTDGKYAVRATNAKYNGETSGWAWIGNTYWTANAGEEGPLAEYQWEPNYIWQLEENQIVDVALNLVLEEKVIATENASIAVGTAPTVPAAFKSNADVVAAYKGLVYFEKDVDTIEEGTTEVNFTAQSAISESFAKAKWFNMNIRGAYWVNMDETEPYYPTTNKDLTADASMWAFGLVEGATSEQIVIWNRAAGADKSLKYTGENDSNGKPLVAMRDGQTAWEAFSSADGFVIRQVGSGDNMYVNQNGGASGPFSIWNNGNARNDGGSVLRIYPVEVEEETLEIALDVERVVGQGYTADVANVDFSEAKEFLGVEEVTEDMLYFVNPDGTEMDYATYSVSPQPDFTYDGWCDADGAAAQWGATTAICVKFFQAIPDGVFSICDMNGADEVGKTYTVKWALKANDKAVVYSINVTFIAAPVTDLTFDDLEVAATEELDVKSELGAAYEGLTATVDIDNILATLEVESLGDVTIAAVQPDGTLDLNYKLGTTDGWRDADGTWKSWVDDLEAAPYFYVKADFASEPQLYQIGGYPGHTDEAAKFTAPYVFVVNGTAKAYLLNVNLIYGEGPESFTYEGTLDQTVTIPGVPDPVATSTGVEETLTITENEDGTVNITYAGFTMAAPAVPLSDFTLENVVVNENEDGSKSYSFEGEVVVTATTGMILTYSATLTGTQAEGEGPTLTLVLAQKSGMANEIVFNPNSTEPTPEPAEYAGMIKQILSHPDTGVQGQATDEQTVKIEAGEDGKVNITYSGFTMPVTGAEIPEFTVEGVTVTENEDGSISYLLEENEDGEMPTVVIVRGTGTVTYKVALEGTQESADATPVLKLVLDNSVVDTVWFGENEKTIDKAIVTGINGVNALGTDGTIFDLSGRKVEKIQRGGIYIVNGKKVSVK